MRAPTMQAHSLALSFVAGRRYMMVIGVGVDIEPIKSFLKKPYEKNKLFYKRIFSIKEIEQCIQSAKPYEKFTAKFCAKEALVKASSSIATCVISDFEILSQKGQSPRVCLWKRKKAQMKVFKNIEFKLSLSHSDQQAIAFALVQQKG